MRKLLLISLLLASNSSFGENLKKVFDDAVKNDPVLSAARQNYKAIAQSTPQARALLLPNIALSASTSDTEQTGTTAFNSDNDNVALTLTQPIFNYSLLIKLKQAKLTVKKAGIELNAAYQDLIIRVTQRYFAVLTAIDKLAFARAEKRAIARQLEQARKRFEVGLIAVTNVHEAKAAHDLAIAQVIAAQNDLSSRQESLREITNQQHRILYQLRPDIPLVSPEPANMQAWTKIALQQNLKLQAVVFDVDLARAEIRSQRSGHMPSVDLIANKSTNKTTGGNFGATDTENNSIELRLKIPLFSGGFTRSKTKEARHRYQQAQQNLERQRREALRQTRDAYRGVITGISRVRALKQAIVSSKSALRATRAGYRVGTRTIVDVLNAQRELFRAQSNYTDARHAYVLNLLQLKQAAGTLSAKDLNAINNWLAAATPSGN